MNQTSQPDAIVYVIDDDAAIRGSLSSLFRSVGLDVRAFASPDEFPLESLQDLPCCLVLDVRLQQRSGLEFQNMLANLNRPIPIIFITGHGDIEMSVQAMKAGAVDFLTKPFREQVLLDAVMEAIQKDRERRTSQGENVQIQQRFAELSAREKEVLLLAVDGKLNKQIAWELDLSLITVKIHRGNAMKKMQAATFADAVRMVESLNRH